MEKMKTHGFIKNKNHFINYLRHAMQVNLEQLDTEAVLPQAFYIRNVYDKGLTDQFTWAIRSQGIHILEEANVLRWLSENNVQSYMVHVNFKHQPTKAFLDTAEDLEGRCGVYSFWNEQGDILYVGMSGSNISSRILDSFGRLATYNRPAFLRYIMTKSACDAAVLEVYFIAKLKPALNKTGKFNDQLSINIDPVPEWSMPILCSRIEETEDGQETLQ